LGAACSRNLRWPYPLFNSFRAGHLRQTYREKKLWNVFFIGIVECTKHFQIFMSVLLILYNLTFLYSHPNISLCHAIYKFERLLPPAYPFPTCNCMDIIVSCPKPLWGLIVMCRIHVGVWKMDQRNVMQVCKNNLEKKCDIRDN